MFDMNFDLLKAVVELVRQFMEQNEGRAIYSNDLKGFTEWINASSEDDDEGEREECTAEEPGLSSDSIISTLLITIGRYAKTYARSAMGNSVFSGRNDFIYLISLKTMGAMTKMELIRYNVHEKSSGILIINRLIRNGWARQTVSENDKRKKYIRITDKGLAILEEHMQEIRKASRILAGNLTHSEQMLLIAILSKLDEFHGYFYRMNLEARDLLDAAYRKLN